MALDEADVVALDEARVLALRCGVDSPPVPGVRGGEPEPKGGAAGALPGWDIPKAKSIGNWLRIESDRLKEEIESCSVSS